MHDDAIAAGNLVITIGEVREKGIAAAIDRALAQVAHCELWWSIATSTSSTARNSPARRGRGPAAWRRTISSPRRGKLAADPRVRVIDLTEWDPPLDPSDLSALTAARWVAECLTGFERR